MKLYNPIDVACRKEDTLLAFTTIITFIGTVSVFIILCIEFAPWILVTVVPALMISRVGYAILKGK